MPDLAVEMQETLQEEERVPVLKAVNLHTWFEIRKFGFFKAGDVRALMASISNSIRRDCVHCR